MFAYVRIGSWIFFCKFSRNLPSANRPLACISYHIRISVRTDPFHWLTKRKQILIISWPWWRWKAGQLIIACWIGLRYLWCYRGKAQKFAITTSLNRSNLSNKYILFFENYVVPNILDNVETRMPRCCWKRWIINLHVLGRIDHVYVCVVTCKFGSRSYNWYITRSNIFF